MSSDDDMDVDNDDFPTSFGGHRHHRYDKEDAMLGVFGSSLNDVNSSHSDRNERRDKNLSAPIGFVNTKSMQVDEDDDENRRSGISRSRSSNKNSSRNNRSSGNRSSNGVLQHKEFGKWEKSTKGFGSKMLHKMGYHPGEGLGKSKEGITRPVEVKVRPTGMGLGFGKFEERTKQAQHEFPLERDADVVAKEKYESELKQWKQKGVTKHPKYVFKTAEEVLAASHEHGEVNQRRSEKVVDMTGPEARIVSGGIEGLNRENQIRASTKDLLVPELLHNVLMLVDMAEADIVSADQQRRGKEDREKSIDYDIEHYISSHEDVERDLARLRKLVGLVAQTCPGSDLLTLEKCEVTFNLLRKDYKDEYIKYGLSTLAVAIVIPLFEELMASWKPFDNPSFGTSSFLVWRRILSPIGLISSVSDNSDPYSHLIWVTIMPHIRYSITSLWSPRVNPDSLVILLETWLPLLPPWIAINVVERLVIPKLELEIDAWAPRSDNIPVHSWLQLWLPILGDRLMPLYIPVRAKLGTAMASWQPSDPSGHAVVAPWVNVWAVSDMDRFLLKFVTPKLGAVMSEFSVNPQNQVLDAFYWLISWCDTLPQTQIVAVLEQEFFPKWLSVLHAWLNHSPNYDEITRWYASWKNLFPASLLSDQQIKAHFNRALDMMNQIVCGNNNVQGVSPVLTSFSAQERTRIQPPVKASIVPATVISHDVKNSLEHLAADHGILFVPLAGRRHEGNALYRFGKTQIYIQRTAIFSWNSSVRSYVPITFDELLQLEQE